MQYMSYAIYDICNICQDAYIVIMHIKQHVQLSKAVKKIVTVVKNDRERKRQRREREGE